MGMVVGDITNKSWPDCLKLRPRPCLMRRKSLFLGYPPCVGQIQTAIDRT